MKNLLILVAMGIAFNMQAQIADSLQRKVVLQGAQNFRDLGGYVTQDGNKVKWGQIYRSADISKLTDQDLKQLEALHLSLVCDLRGPSEIKNSPDKLPAGARYLNLPAGSESLPSTMSYGKLNTDSLMRSIYSNVSFLQAKYKPMFEELITLPENKALMFHCTAGKDRTGLAAALVLSALGVDEQTILEDYQATNYYWKSTQEKMTKMMVQSGMDEEKAKAMLGANRSYMETFLSTIKKQYGSMNAFLAQELGLDKVKLAQLKSRYLIK